MIVIKKYNLLFDSHTWRKVKGGLSIIFGSREDYVCVVLRSYHTGVGTYDGSGEWRLRWTAPPI